MSIEWGPDEGTMSWTDAVAFVEAKGEGWRLPTVQELVSQFDYSKGQPKDAGVQCKSYWCCSAYSDAPIHAWVVNLCTGLVYTSMVIASLHVRLVREVKP